MDLFSKLNRQFKFTSYLIIVLSNVVIFGSYIVLKIYSKLSFIDISLIILGLIIVFNILIVSLAMNYFVSPLKSIWQIIVAMSSNDSRDQALPNLDKLKIGKDFAEKIHQQILALIVKQADLTKTTSDKNQPCDINNEFVANKMPLPVLIVNHQQAIIYANKAFYDYLGLNPNITINQNLYTTLDFSFPSSDTLDNWLTKIKNDSAVASHSWERVKLNLSDTHPMKIFDLAVYYNSANPNNYELMLVLFDHTSQYSQDDQAISFVALSVHELRTPLTILRGYIEVLEDELDLSDNPELQNFMTKMVATAQQLTTFVNNILNVARIDNDQLQLTLKEENWQQILTSAIDNIKIRATVRGINIETNIQPNLPSVAVDRLSIYEVLNNLIDNAIKYSGKSKLIKISSQLNNDGLIETSVQDFGLGINNSILGNLFTKFYRDHHNRAQIGGTGLGLYLSKSVISAHGGNIWVNSTPNKGSTFTFSLLPYSKLAKNLNLQDNKTITSNAYGWIKNHSLYKR